jgi:hypothetical protein
MYQNLAEFNHIPCVLTTNTQKIQRLSFSVFNKKLNYSRETDRDLFFCCTEKSSCRQSDRNNSPTCHQGCGFFLHFHSVVSYGHIVAPKILALLSEINRKKGQEKHKRLIPEQALAC